MREPYPIQQWLPAGPLRDMGERYVSQLPDVEQNPIRPESLVHHSDHSWSEYLVAYSLLYPGVVILLAILGGAGMWAMFHFCKRREYRHRIVCPECGTVMYPWRPPLSQMRSAESLSPRPELARVFPSPESGAGIRKNQA